MNNQYLQLSWMLLAGFLFLAGCGQMKTTEQVAPPESPQVALLPPSTPPSTPPLVETPDGLTPMQVEERPSAGSHGGIQGLGRTGQRLPRQILLLIPGV